MAACTPAVVLLNLKHRSEATPLVIDALKQTFVNCSVEEHSWCLDPDSKEGRISDHGLKVAKKLMSEGPFNASMILRWFDQCHDGKVMPIRDIVMDYFGLKDEPKELLRKSADNVVIRLTTRISKSNRKLMDDLNIEVVQGRGAKHENVKSLSKVQ